MTRAILVALIAILVSGCAQTPEKVVVPLVREKPRLPMSDACHAESLLPFKGVAMKAGDQTESSALAHALQNAKSRMSRNRLRVESCECSIAEESKNPDDLKRLGGRCTPKSPPATPPAGPVKVT